MFQDAQRGINSIVKMLYTTQKEPLSERSLKKKVRLDKNGSSPLKAGLKNLSEDIVKTIKNFTCNLFFFFNPYNFEAVGNKQVAKRSDIRGFLPESRDTYTDFLPEKKTHYSDIENDLGNIEKERYDNYKNLSPVETKLKRVPRAIMDIRISNISVNSNMDGEQQQMRPNSGRQIIKKLMLKKTALSKDLIRYNGD